jgi:hypothetical protein
MILSSVPVLFGGSLGRRSVSFEGCPRHTNVTGTPRPNDSVIAARQRASAPFPNRLVVDIEKQFRKLEWPRHLESIRVVYCAGWDGRFGHRDKGLESFQR